MTPVFSASVQFASSLDEVSAEPSHSNDLEDVTDP
jgi:hypothetical protein